jgi:hypothetical protein
MASEMLEAAFSMRSEEKATTYCNKATARRCVFRAARSDAISGESSWMQAVIRYNLCLSHLGGCGGISPLAIAALTEQSIPSHWKS